ncbi:MAG TPA: TIM barrel protein [Vicinamibacterales bacterium]|nr:TIM barrel protein [Vicinamibacterales bacterium]
MPTLTRRQALTAAGAALLAGAPFESATAQEGRRVLKGRLKQSVCRWCYAKIPLRDFFKSVADLGLTAVDLLGEDDWPIAAEYGLICSMGQIKGTGTIPDALNVRANHDAIAKNFERGLPIAVKHKVPNVITFFGNRRGMSDAEAIDNCVAGLNRVKKVAEDHGVTICVELLNSKVDHKDYQGDHTAFGVAVVKAVGSPRVKLLYDIYHMQIMEGDLIRTIRDNREYIAHFHTGGVPGRNELDDTQEVNWRTVADAIADTGFDGYFAHEFIPKRDPLTSLREAVELCEV